MLFKIVQGYEKKDRRLFVSGFLTSNAEETDESFVVMANIFREMQIYKGKLKSKDKSLFFKNVDASLLKCMLDYLSRELNVDIEYQLTETFEGDRGKAVIYFK